MARKTLSKYKLGTGSGLGSWRDTSKSIYFCVECHMHGLHRNHSAARKTREVVLIPSQAQLPRKNAPKRQWAMFIEKFVEQKQLKEKRAELDKKKNQFTQKEKYARYLQQKIEDKGHLLFLEKIAQFKRNQKAA